MKTPGGSRSKVLGWRLDGSGSKPGRGKMEIFFTLNVPDWHRGPLSLL